MNIPRRRRKETKGTKVHAGEHQAPVVEEWLDVEAALEAERQRREAHLGRLASLVSASVLVAALWLGWPGIQAVLGGQSAPLSALGVPALVLVFGTLVHDHASSEADAVARALTGASVAWPAMLFLAFRQVEVDGLEQILASVVLISLTYALYATARTGTGGGFRAARYRALLTVVGAVLIASLWFGLRTEVGPVNDLAGGGITLMALGVAANAWFVEDQHRGLRKEFKSELDAVESKILELRASGRRVDQAASLARTAAAEGYSDPEHGMRLLRDAMEDIERTISLEQDVVIIEADALKSVEEAEAVAPNVRRPRSAFDAARREVDLGSLREGEALFRQAKRRAAEISAWWERAEEAIKTASSSLSGRQEDHLSHLHEALDEARRLMLRESPEKAHLLASVIPDQVAVEATALEDAEEVVREARRALEASDGLDKAPHEQRLTQAEEALAGGDGRSAAGLAEGVRRSLLVEREAMDVVRRALRQRSTLEGKFSDLEDESEWKERLAEVEEAADARQWTRARRGLEDLTADLEALDRDLGEADQLLAFLQEEWRTLRHRAEAATIGVGDEDRMSVERHLGNAAEAIRKGATGLALQELSSADEAMERLRRRC